MLLALRPPTVSTPRRSKDKKLSRKSCHSGLIYFYKVDFLLLRSLLRLILTANVRTTGGLFKQRLWHLCVIFDFECVICVNGVSNKLFWRFLVGVGEI